jgi:uncharacterized RDD family membrane protein YckC
MASIKIPTAFNIDLEFEASDISRRFIAWLIDLAIRIAYVSLVWVAISYNGWPSSLVSVLMLWLVLMPVSLYFLIFEVTMHGQTPGKRALGLKVVSILGNTPGFSQHLIRWMFRLLETPFMFWGVVPVLAIARSPYNQRLGDLVAGTIVIDTKTKSSIDETIFREISATDYRPRFPEIMKLPDKDLNKVKELLDQAVRSNNMELAAMVSQRVKEVLHIDTDMEPRAFLETVLNDYNYYTTR